MKKIVSWNVASIRARMDTLLTLLEKEKPDVVFFQEIKVEEDKFPFFELKSVGYESVVSGQKAWNGVAVLSKEPITLKSVALEGFEDQARFVEAVQSDGTHLISVYVPNGQAPANDPTDTSRLEYKLKWLAALKKYLQGIEKYIVGGDFNVIEQDPHETTLGCKVVDPKRYAEFSQMRDDLVRYLQMRLEKRYEDFDFLF